MADKKATLDKVLKTVETGFGAVAEDIADIRKTVATKDDISMLQTQVNSIETHLRGMNHFRLEGRVADLEEKIFGKAR